MDKKRLFTLRTNDAELQKWQALALASGLTLADLIRQQLQSALVGRHPVRQQTVRPVANPLTLLAIARAGNCINQIAKACNTHKSRIDSVQVIAALIAIDRRLAAELDAASKKG